MVPWPLRFGTTLSLAIFYAACIQSRVCASKDFKLNWAKDRWYNPSLVYNSQNSKYISAAKSTSFRKERGKIWWDNTLFMCEGARSAGGNGDSIHDGIHNMVCQTWDPWHGNYSECELDKRVRGGKIDMSGLGDVKVWRWPGKGIYAIFGRKPQRSPLNPSCSGLIVYHQWLVMVMHEDGDLGILGTLNSDGGNHSDDDPRDDGVTLSGTKAFSKSARKARTEVNEGKSLSSPSPWILEHPLPLLPSTPERLYPSSLKFSMEKNWMPFVYKDTKGSSEEDRLFVTYSVQPHIVLEVLPDGACVHRWTTHDAKMMLKFAAFDVHGGPPLSFVPEGLLQSESQSEGQEMSKPFYLGIMHHIEKFDGGRIRLYRHFAFKVSNTPPFEIIAVSDELPLVFNVTYKAKTAFITFVAGLDVDPLTGLTYITYGAADAEARVLIMTLQEMDKLFTGQVKFRNIHVPYQPSLHKIQDLKMKD